MQTNLFIVLIALSQIASYSYADENLCNSQTYGKVITHCTVVQNGNITGQAPFTVSSLDLCFKDYNHTRAYIAGTVSGTYTATTESKDSVFPGYAPEPNSIRSRSKSSGTYRYGAPFEQSILFPIDYRDIKSAGNVESYIMKSREDGGAGYYQEYRSQTDYSSVTRTGTLKYERKEGLFSRWSTIVQFSFKCSR